MQGERRTDGRTEILKLIVAFCSFAYASENDSNDNNSLELKMVLAG